MKKILIEEISLRPYSCQDLRVRGGQKMEIYGAIDVIKVAAYFPSVIKL